MASNVLISSAMARGTFPITPDDDNDLTQGKAYGIRVLTGGDVTYVGEDGNTDTVTLNDGERWPVVIKRVLATGTDATDITGFALFG